MTIPVDYAHDRTSVPPAQPLLGANVMPTRFKDPMPVPPVLHPTRLGSISLATVHMRTVMARLHSELPPTRLWAYDGVFPGPTIEVRRGERLRVAWTNQLAGKAPLVSVAVPWPNPAQDVFPGLVPGRAGATPDPRVSKLPPWTVVHLHGARTGGGNDGWPENAVLPGDVQLAEYPNDQPASALWYHDHAMAITRFNVMSGLAGMYIIRDEEEDALQLPRGRHELPIILQDRNLDTTADGRLTGQLLVKTVIFNAALDVQIPFFGPFTLVNGCLWPHLDVARRWYRFRILNAASAREYNLELHGDDGVIPDAMVQIGGDGGLFKAPVPVGRLRLAPSERADVLVNFGARAGQTLRLVNVTPDPFTPPDDAILELRVARDRCSDPFVLPKQLSPSFKRYGHDNGTIPTDHGHRYLVLTPPTAGHPELWEMEKVDSAPEGEKGIVELVEVVRDANGNEQARRPVILKRVARRFGDALSFRVIAGKFEVWNIINVGAANLPPGPDPTHPMHIHLIQFQALTRTTGDMVMPDGVTRKFDAAAERTLSPIEFDVRPHEPDQGIHPNEQGWKDVISVDAGTWVKVAGEFAGASGRFVYHCHILDHEDAGMMRPFSVMPEEAAALDPEHGEHGHEHSPKKNH